MSKQTMGTRILTVLFALIMIAAGAGFFALIIRPTRGADLRLPNYITCGAARCDSPELGRFGAYSLKYYERRWKRMCQGSARYAAMREAYEMGRPQPCN